MGTSVDESDSGRSRYVGTSVDESDSEGSRQVGTSVDESDSERSRYVGTSADESDAALHVMINDMKHTLTRRLDQLATDNEILNTNQQELKKENKEMKKDNEEMKKENEEMKKENKEIKKENKEVKKENDEIKLKMNELASQNEQLKSNQVRSDTAMAKMKQHMNDMEQHMNGMGPQTMEPNKGGENLHISGIKTEHRQQIHHSPSGDAHDHEILPASHHVTRPCDDEIKILMLQVDQVNTKVSKVMTQNKEITSHLQELHLTGDGGNSNNISHGQGMSFTNCDMWLVSSSES